MVRQFYGVCKASIKCFCMELTFLVKRIPEYASVSSLFSFSFHLEISMTLKGRVRIIWVQGNVGLFAFSILKLWGGKYLSLLCDGDVPFYPRNWYP